MLRDQSGSLGLGRAQQRLGHAPVQQPPPSQADLVVHQRAQLVVGEVVARLGARQLAHQAAPDQLVEPLRGLLVAAAGGGAHGVELEGATDHRRRLEQLPRDRPEAADARAQQAAHLVRQRLRRLVAGAQRGQVLGHEQRQPLALDEHPPSQLGSRIRPRRLHQRPDLLLVEATRASPPSPRRRERGRWRGGAAGGPAERPRCASSPRAAASGRAGAGRGSRARPTVASSAACRSSTTMRPGCGPAHAAPRTVASPSSSRAAAPGAASETGSGSPSWREASSGSSREASASRWGGTPATIAGAADRTASPSSSTTGP